MNCQFRVFYACNSVTFLFIWKKKNDVHKSCPIEFKMTINNSHCCVKLSRSILTRWYRLSFSLVPSFVWHDMRVHESNLLHAEQHLKPSHEGWTYVIIVLDRYQQTFHVLQWIFNYTQSRKPKIVHLLDCSIAIIFLFSLENMLVSYSFSNLFLSGALMNKFLKYSFWHFKLILLKINFKLYQIKLSFTYYSETSVIHGIHRFWIKGRLKTSPYSFHFLSHFEFCLA